MLAIAMTGQQLKRSVKRHHAPRNNHLVQMSILALQMKRLRKLYAEIENTRTEVSTLLEQPIQSNKDEKSI
jgi:hypothetical protein